MDSDGSGKTPRNIESTQEFIRRYGRSQKRGNCEWRPLVSLKGGRLGVRVLKEGDLESEESMATLSHLPSHISHKHQRDYLSVSTVFRKRIEAAAPFAGRYTILFPTISSSSPKFHGCQVPACAGHFSCSVTEAPTMQTGHKSLCT